MTVLVEELRKALVEAGISADLAEQAAAAVLPKAEAVTRTDVHRLELKISEGLGKLDARLAGLEGKLDSRLAAVESKLEVGEELSIIPAGKGIMLQPVVRKGTYKLGDLVGKYRYEDPSIPSEKLYAPVDLDEESQ
jgi:hypothetical protein